MQRLQDLVDQLKNMIPDKELLKKKIASLENKVSISSVSLHRVDWSLKYQNLELLFFCNLHGFDFIFVFRSNNYTI